MYKHKVTSYNHEMKRFSVSSARQHLAEVVEAVESEPVTLVRHGVPAAVVLSPALFESLLSAAEELDDIEAFDSAIAESEPNLPWDDVRAELGWT